MFKIRIIIIFFITFRTLSAQEFFDSCNCEKDRLLNTYNRLKSKYIEVAQEKLLYYLNRDSILKNEFLAGDSINYKNLQIKIIPLLKLDYSARNYYFGDNICRCFIFDTINYIVDAATFFLKSKWTFMLNTIRSNCCSDYIYPGGKYLSDEEKESGYFFNQNVYKLKERNDYVNGDSYQFDSNYFNSFVFSVDGLDRYIIKNLESNISVLYNRSDKIDYPNEYIKEVYNEEWIRYCARRYPIGGNPWWRFWDWGIFLKVPYTYKRRD
jgi:hypothetical protein